MSRYALAAWILLGGAACRSGPSEENLTNDLFADIEAKRLKYIEAWTGRSQSAVSKEALELTRVAGENYVRIERELASPHLPRRLDAVFALGFSQRREAVGPLLEAVREADPGLRARAIVALGMLAFPEVPVEPFKKMLEDSSWELRVAALVGLRSLLGSVGERGMLPGLHECLRDPYGGVRNEAVIVLGVVRREESIPYLLDRSIKDPEPMVRANAAYALKALGRKALMANPFLIEMLRDEYAKVVFGAWEALNAINEKDLDRSYGTWRDWYEDEQRHVYVCPDHKESLSALPGECKVCGRKLERTLKDSGPKRVEGAPGLYACPEHPDVVTTTPSYCARPGCGRALVPKKPEPAVWVCPDHPEVTTTTPSTCARPGCGKPLVPRK